MIAKFVIVLVFAASFGNGQDSDQAKPFSNIDEIVNDIKCIRILDCPEALELMKHKPLTKAKKEYLRSIKCGQGENYPHVWCTVLRPNITTDTRVVGIKKPSFLPRIEDAECGTVDSGNKLHGGEDTNLGEFPWMAWLEYRSKNQKLQGKCAGTLISNRYVMTAAHCIEVGANNGVLESVLMGEYDTVNETDCIPNPWGKPDCSDPPRRYAIEGSVVHPLYKDSANAKLYHHDIGLIRLAQVVEYTSYIRPICLPNPRGDQTTGFFTVAGWGRTASGQPSTVLQKLRLPRFDTEQCTAILKYNVTDTQVCAGGEQGKDSCRGDSGGPLMFLGTQDQLWIQMGVISIRVGNRCGVGLPAIYTDVQKHILWVWENVRE